MIFLLLTDAVRDQHFTILTTHQISGQRIYLANLVMNQDLRRITIEFGLLAKIGVLESEGPTDDYIGISWIGYFQN